jgi:hypothetical protein
MTMVFVGANHVHEIVKLSWLWIPKLWAQMCDSLGRVLSPIYIVCSPVVLTVPKLFRHTAVS